MKNVKWIAISILGIMILLFVCNIHLIVEPAVRYATDELDFEGFKNEIQENLKSADFFLRNQFINLNGLYARVMGRRVVNEVIMLENGMLTDEYVPFDYHIEYIGERVTEFSRQIETLGIPFSYIQMPYKMDLAQTLLPKGNWNHGNENADNLLMLLNEKDVQTYDLRKDISATVADIEKNFFYTDHHWNFSGAFLGFQIMMPLIQRMVDDHTDISIYLDKESWKEIETPYPFLGTYGKRVGKYFAGFDSVEYYVPDFETHIVCEMPVQNRSYEGDFDQAIIRYRYIEEANNYFDISPYCLYLGGHSELYRFRNENAPIHKKILIMGDSFMLPVQSFMSTVFTEVDVIDPRHYKDSLIAYIAQTRPDAVIIAVNPSTLTYMKRFNYGDENDLVNQHADKEI